MDMVSAPVLFEHVAQRLLLAALLGAVIGFNRELQQKPAGLRTHALVALGASLLTLVGLMLAPSDAGGEAASRVMQGIVAGVGFIGGGVILHRSDKKEVHGLTTAASIWVVAAVGMATGVGLWRSAITVVVITLLVLEAGERFDHLVERWAERHGSVTDED